MSRVYARWNADRFVWRGGEFYGSAYFKPGGVRLYARELRDAEVGEAIRIDSRWYEVRALTKTKNGRPGAVLARIDRGDQGVKTAEEIAAEAFEAEWYRLDYVTEPDRHRRALTAGLDAFKDAHTPTAVLAERERAALHAEEGYRLDERCDDIAKRIRSGEPATIAARPEPQGEPSDAQVTAALAVFNRDAPSYRQRMRAALRAAQEAQ